MCGICSHSSFTDRCFIIPITAAGIAGFMPIRSIRSVGIFQPSLESAFILSNFLIWSVQWRSQSCFLPVRRDGVAQPKGEGKVEIQKNPVVALAEE